MPRKDLGENIHLAILSILEENATRIFEKVKPIRKSRASGRIWYEVTSKNGSALPLDSIYQDLAKFFEDDIGCSVTLEEFPGDPEKDIPASIEGMLMVCDANKVFLHIEKCGKQIEINVWPRQ